MLSGVNKLSIFKSLLTTPSNVLPLHLNQTFPLVILIFTEGEVDGIESRLPLKIFSILIEFIIQFLIEFIIQWSNVMKWGVGQEMTFHGGRRIGRSRATPIKKILIMGKFLENFGRYDFGKNFIVVAFLAKLDGPVN